MGHYNKHCQVNLNRQHAIPQYGEWLRAGSADKGGTDRMRPSTSKSRESIEDENARERSQMELEKIQISTQIGGGATEARKESQTLEVQTRKCQILQQLIIQKDRTVEDEMGN